MKAGCMVCAWIGEVANVAAPCGGCGAHQALRPVRESELAGWLKPGDPICGPSRVETNRPPLSQMRSVLDEPLEVTRARVAARERLEAGGMEREQARAAAVVEVPIQCGLCGGKDRACRWCLGRATAPTAVLTAAARPKRSKGRRQSAPQTQVARVAATE